MTAVPALTLVDVPEVEPERQINRRTAYTHDECIALARVWERETGAPPTCSDWNPARRRTMIRKLLVRIRDHRDAIQQFEEGGYPSAITVRKLFGSWNAFMHAAGWTPREGGRQISISAVEPPPTPTREQVRRRVGQQAQRSPWGRDALARVVKNVIEAEHAGDKQALKGVLLEGAAQLLAWADSIPEER